MKMPPLPDNVLDMPDYELGGLLLGWFIAVQADDLGIPFEQINQIPEHFAEQVRKRVLTIETDTVENFAVEKALHKAASGDFETAGRFIREHMISGGVSIVSMKFAPIGIKFTRGRKPNTVSPIRKAIAKLLKANSAIKNPEIWESMKHKSPRGWTACDNHLGKYFEGPENKNMNYERFCNVCSDERKKIKQ
ncbi:hypothetical protein SCD_n01194 [Sulfuricella denitrificans skB26]|uniref:Uncharacterized protein n=1 Tax=Sulfuricella denitrificans (strain DSM 22764 / NBRC 105220 / skB26) TaxID=1163617 RepID=S6ABU8_SULDS|nr:hypothetical protein [Sulfuricella denitrificans]BAN35023.1 hypothetical protein SCD_n01194 [Sulfuricella denitrificans skB26]